MIETFVDREKYLGTCYIAANWKYLGVTKGYGRRGNKFEYHGQIKDIYVYIVDRSFAREFQPDLKRLRNGREELEAMINGIPTWHASILKELGISGDFTLQIRQHFANHIEKYMEYLGNKQNRAHFITMEKGFLSDLERKSIEPIALAYAGSGSVRNLTNFMGTSKWDEEGMRIEYRKDMSTQIAHEDGMITLDDTGFPKKGGNSVGVARQYCGATGKTDNCQVGVMAGYVSQHGYGLIDYELYIPEKWFDDEYANLRDKCGVPKNLGFRTKNEIVFKMLHETVNSDLFPAKYVGVDSAYGKDSALLDSLPEGMIYFADVRKDLLVFAERPKMIMPSYSGKGRRDLREKPEFPPRSVEDIAKDSGLPWNDVVLDIGAKGPIITNDKYLLVTEVRNGKPGKNVWLYVRRLSNGKMKYALCNEAPDASAEDLRRPALMRWSIEQCFGECKGYLGMGHYESRSWVGWRRHMLLCLIAHLFIIKLRMEYSCEPPSTGSAPYIEEPVPLDDYLEAAADMINFREITHPCISAAPSQYQQIMTIGLIRALIKATFVKIGAVLCDINYRLKSAADAFDSHSRSTLNRAFLNRFGLLLDSG